MLFRSPVFERSTEIAAPIEDVFAFHLDTRNVPLITPPAQQVTEIEGSFPLVVGAIVDMKVRQSPVPTAQPWRIRIVAIEEPTLVVDELIKGPFAQFRHEHRFARNASGGTTLTDHVEWKLPGGIAAKAIEPIAKAQLEKSFTQRQAATKRILEAEA